MRYAEVLRECAEQRAGSRQQISMACAKAIAGYFTNDSDHERNFVETGAITTYYDELWEKFFPKRQRSDAEWSVAKAMYDYLYSRRNHPEGPRTWAEA